MSCPVYILDWEAENGPGHGLMKLVCVAVGKSYLRC